MESVIMTFMVSVVVSTVVTKTITAHHFKVIDSYVHDVIDLAKKKIQESYSSRDKR